MRKKMSTLMVYVLAGLLSVGVLPYPAYSLISLGGGLVKWGSITDFIHGSGAANPDKKPSEIKMRTDFLTASVRCQNNGNQSQQANGSPFNVSGGVSGSTPITDAQVDDKGNFDITFFISDQQINATITVPADACKQNWTVVPGSLRLNTFQQNFKAFYCTDLTCTATTTTDPVDENTIFCTVDLNLQPNHVGCVVTFDAGGRLFTVNAS